jgi:hypothetical protein
MWSEITWSWLKLWSQDWIEAEHWLARSHNNIQLRLGLDEGKVLGSLLLIILSSDIICEYHFNRIRFFHFEMGKKFELEDVDQPCAQQHIGCTRSLDQNLSCICLINTHYTWMPPSICLVCHFSSKCGIGWQMPPFRRLGLTAIPYYFKNVSDAIPS